MKQSIKILNQSAKILGIYVECIIHRFNSNNKLLHIRLVPINISNRYATSYYTKHIKAQQRMNYLVILSF